MPESSLPGDEPEIRPEVVQAIFSAMADNNSAKLNDLLRSGVTTGEYLQAMNQYGESPASESPVAARARTSLPTTTNGNSKPSSCSPVTAS